MKNIKKVVSESKNLSSNGLGWVIEVFYDIKGDKLLWEEHPSVNSWTIFDNKYIIQVGYLTKPTTMKELQAMVSERLNWLVGYGDLD